MKFILLVLTIFTCGLALNSCGNKGNKAVDESKMQGKEYTSAYICPMHCEGSGSDSAGVCPVCGMDYVANTDTKSESESHEGHDHGEEGHEGHNH